MWPYWLMFFPPAWFALKQISAIENHRLILPRWDVRWRMAFVFLSLMIGLRHEVGGDWFAYLNHLEGAAYQTLDDVVREGEPTYALLNFIGSRGLGGVYFVNTVCAILFAWGLVVFCKQQSRPWLALVVAIPYLVIVIAMGYTRQGVVIGLVMLGLVALQQGRVWRFLLWVGLAATFHKSAVILLPIAIFAKSKNRWLTILGAVISAYILYLILLKDSLSGLMHGYIEAQYSSSGAAIRVLMNALPAAIFLWYKRGFIAMTREQRSFWTWMSLGALGLVILLWVSPSSTAVDRIALYWIPLQLVVWSQVPDVFGEPLRSNRGWTVAVIIYSAIVLFTWLGFAANASAWLPYKFYPWEALWQ